MGETELFKTQNQIKLAKCFTDLYRTKPRTLAPPAGQNRVTATTTKKPKRAERHILQFNRFLFS